MEKTNESSRVGVTIQNILDLGFHQIRSTRYSNGWFDLFISKSGAVILYVQGRASSASSITDVDILKSLVYLNIITSVGLRKQRLS